MAEWSNALVLKTSILNGIGGSNPSASASGAQNDPDVLYEMYRAFFCFGVLLPRHILFRHIRNLSHNLRNRLIRKS